MESVGSLGGFQIRLRYMHFDVKIWQEIGISDGLVLSSFVCHMFSCLDGSVCSEASDPLTSFLPGWQRRISRGWKWDSAGRVERDNYNYSYIHFLNSWLKMMVSRGHVESLFLEYLIFSGLSLCFFLLGPDGIASFCPPSRWFEKYHQGKLDRSCLKIAGLKLHGFSFKQIQTCFSLVLSHIGTSIDFSIYFLARLPWSPWRSAMKSLKRCVRKRPWFPTKVVNLKWKERVN